MKHQQHSFWRMWGWPIVLGLLTTLGLISALFSDGGFGDIVACVWFGWLRRSSAR